MKETWVPMMALMNQCIELMIIFSGGKPFPFGVRFFAAQLMSFDSSASRSTSGCHLTSQALDVVQLPLKPYEISTMPWPDVMGHWVDGI